MFAVTVRAGYGVDAVGNGNVRLLAPNGATPATPRSVIASPTLEMCADLVYIDTGTGIDASGLGFAAGDHSAVGAPPSDCSHGKSRCGESTGGGWSGAGHGGNGGASNASDVLMVAEGIGFAYLAHDEGQNETLLTTPHGCGSPGGGQVVVDPERGDTIYTGGSGGGLLRMIVDTTFILYGILAVEGGNGTVYGSIGNRSSGGGGSGGTILLRMTSRSGLEGHRDAPGRESLASAAGGGGGIGQFGGGGGGGGGGRMQSFWADKNQTLLEAASASASASAHLFFPKIRVEGGHRGATIAGDGGWGSENSVDCPLGTGNFTCETCRKGYEPTNGTSQRQCVQCQRGSFSASVSTDKCHACSPGLFAGATGLSVCTMCTIGRDAVLSGMGECNYCCCDDTCNLGDVARGYKSQAYRPCCDSPAVLGVNGTPTSLQPCRSNSKATLDPDGDACPDACIAGTTSWGDPTTSCVDPLFALTELFSLLGLNVTPTTAEVLLVFITIVVLFTTLLITVALVKLTRAIVQRILIRREDNVTMKDDRNASLLGASGGGRDAMNRSGEFLKMENTEMMSTARRLTDRDLSRVICRVYFGGTNSPYASWRCPTQAPLRVASDIDSMKWSDFANGCNVRAKWRVLGWERVVHGALSLMYWPLAPVFINFRRRVRFRNLQKFIVDNDVAGSLLQLKFNCSPDASLAYLDVLRFRAVEARPRADSSVSNFSTESDGMSDGQPRLPLLLLFAGDGGYLRPLHLDPNDVLVRSPPTLPRLRCYMGEYGIGWIDFVHRINSLLWGVDPLHLVATVQPLRNYVTEVNSRADSEALHMLGGLTAHLVEAQLRDDSGFDLRSLDRVLNDDERVVPSLYDGVTMCNRILGRKNRDGIIGRRLGVLLVKRSAHTARQSINSGSPQREHPSSNVSDRSEALSNTSSESDPSARSSLASFGGFERSNQLADLRIDSERLMALENDQLDFVRKWVILFIFMIPYD
mgnify:FL=1